LGYFYPVTKSNSMTITKKSASTSTAPATYNLVPVANLGVYDTALACRAMIKSGIPKSVVAAHLFVQDGPGGLSLDYLEMRYGKMSGPRKPKA
jgi:hypothetical protein